MALLDFNDPQQAGLLAIAASLLRSSGASPYPVGVGQAIGQAVPEGFQASQATNLANSRAALQNAQVGEYQSIADWRKAEAQKLQRQLEIQQQIGQATERLSKGQEPYPGAWGNTAAQGPSISPQSADAITGITGVPTAPQGAQASFSPPHPGGSNLFNPQYYGAIADLYNHYGDPDTALKYTNQAREMEQLRLSGYSSHDTGSKVAVMRGGQVVGYLNKDMPPDKVQEALMKLPGIASDLAKTSYETGAHMPSFGMTMDANGQPSFQFGGMGTPSAAPAGPPGSAKTPLSQSSLSAPGAPKGGAFSGMAPKAADEARTKAIGQQTEQLTKDYESLQQIPQGIAALDNAIKLAGTAVPFQGSKAEQKLAVAKFLNNNLGMNLDPKAVANAETMRSALFLPIMTNLKKMDSNPTERQQQALKEALGSLETDPAALPRVLMIYRESLTSRLQQHNERATQAMERGLPFAYDIRFKIPDAPQVTPAKSQPMSRDDLKKKYGLQ